MKLNTNLDIISKINQKIRGRGRKTVSQKIRGRGRKTVFCLLILSMLLYPARITFADNNTAFDEEEQISMSESNAKEQDIAGSSTNTNGHVSLSTSLNEEGQDSVKQKKEKKITITGLKKNYKKPVSPKAIIQDDIRIKPAIACTVSLQNYNKKKAAWETVKTFNIKESDEGRLRLTYPSTWKQSLKSKWRVVIPPTNDYAAYVSSTVTIISSRPANANISLGSRGAVIIRANDGYVIYGKNKDKHLPNASTTKMLTALLTIEQGKLNATTKISKRATDTPFACLEAVPGTKFRIKDLLSVMLIRSSNDAAACLAEKNAGTIEKFCRKMNRRARKLGCKNTHFVNPHGLDHGNHYSTPYDLALIQRECMRHQIYMDIVKKKSVSFSSLGKNKKHYNFDTTDELLGNVKGLLGGKTGHTTRAGDCFCGIYKYNGVVYIFTVLGNDESEGRWRDCKKLMKFIRQNYE